MTATSLVILAMTLAPPSQAPAAAQAAQADARKPITLTGCVVAATDREDTLQLVAAEPEPGRAVGTAGISPAWTVPSYLLLGGIVRFSEHANRTVEITGVLEPPVDAPADPKKTGDTTSRTAPPAPAVARLQVQHAKVVASTCTPKKDK
jgi:hypothetical protein